jgi:starch synthase
MADAICRALELYADKKQYAVVRKNAMSGDYSWEASAKKYLELYESII